MNIPEGVEELSSNLFAHCTQLEALEIPSTVSYLGYNVFWDCNSLKTISGVKGSAAEEYAERFGLTFEAVGQD